MLIHEIQLWSYWVILPQSNMARDDPKFVGFFYIRKEARSSSFTKY
jgi:hypothetical protein